MNFSQVPRYRHLGTFVACGNTVIEYSLVSHGPGDIADPAYLADMSAFAYWYRSQPETRHVMAISDTFRQLNKSMHGDDPNACRLRVSRDLAVQYLLLHELSLPLGLDLNNRINVSKSATRMTVTAKTLSSREVLDLNARAGNWLEQNAPNIIRFESAGPALMFANIGQRNIRAMLFGTAIAFLGVSAVLLFALRSLRVGLISLAPNFVPGLMGFGIWGLAVGEVGLASDFSILVLSPFLPTASVGMLASLIMVLALLADFLLLPPLLMALDRRKS